MKLLLAGDSQLYRKMLRGLLEVWGYEVVLAADGYEAQRILDGHDAPRLAILDCLMPGHRGALELCALIRARKQSYVYTILLSAADQKSEVLKGFELGADDCLIKPLEELDLRARLKVGERTIRSHEKLVKARGSLQFEASHDSLLRIWNHKAIVELLSTELSRAKRSQIPLSVLFANMDFFQSVNDTYGHLIGDDVLRSAAEKMSSALREYDQVGRYRGDKFLVVLPNCTTEAAREVAERVRQHIGFGSIWYAPLRVDITVSIGVSQWHSSQEINELLQQADRALYRAKQNGRNRVEVDDSS